MVTDTHTVIHDARRLAAQLEVRVITPHSGLDGLTASARAILSGFGPAWRLGWRFFVRDTKAENRQSLLGYVWLVAPVLANTLTWIFLNSTDVVDIKSGPVPYPLFVLSGVLLWTAFNGSIMAMLGVMGAARGILAKVNFPHESLIYSAFLRSGLDVLLAAFLLVPTVIVVGGKWHVGMVLYPLALLSGLLLGTAVGLFFLPVSALYNDVSRGLQLVLRFGFFFTPVIYALPQHGIARRIMLLNPLTPIVEWGRAAFVGATPTMTNGFIEVTLASVVLIALGLVTFKLAVPHIIERIGG